MANSYDLYRGERSRKALTDYAARRSWCTVRCRTTTVRVRVSPDKPDKNGRKPDITVLITGTSSWPEL